MVKRKSGVPMSDREKSLTAMTAFLQERLRQPLPGLAAHTVMIPFAAGGIRFKYKTTAPSRRGSVLILLYEGDHGVYFPLIKRPAYTGVHGGQVSLPGGKADPGETAIETAVREGEEEIGIDRGKVIPVGELTSFTVSVSNIFITPVVGIYSDTPKFKPDVREVDKILVYSVSDLLRQEEIPNREILASGNLPLVAPHFQVDDEIIWGATAMVLNELRMVLRGE